MLARFLAKVRFGNGCWNWTGATSKGYGDFRWNGASKAHRVAWVIHSGMPVPEGLWVLHHCDNPKCVRPSHLYLGNVLDNTRDRIVRVRDANLRKTHCPSGHPYTGENLRRMATGERRCRTCQREFDARRRPRP